MFGRKSRSDDAWQDSSNALRAAQDAHDEARQTYGANSPQAQAADEAAFAEADRHFGEYGNPADDSIRPFWR
ncbi:hypothetical protein ABT099_23515 [Streptomyces prasinus]|uniref:hypothetical protein n=1 Tax=Streptomyces prasinus TaxID=67345 RepID=UPI0033274CF6